MREYSLSNSDLAPVPQEKRTWRLWHIAALWIGMAICITTYTLASSLITQGMNWQQAILTILLGNLIVLIPLTLNAFPGTRYGIPFPILLRASFGTLGSNIPAMMRAVVACGWFGIQTWIGGSAIYGIAVAILNLDPATATPLPILGISAGQFLCFMIFWVINIIIIIKGMDCIKWVETWSAPFLIIVGLALLVWAYTAAKGWGPILNQPARIPEGKSFLQIFAPGLTAMVGYWATLSLNISDFSRYARTQRDQILGQFLGLPWTMALYSFIGIAVTSATLVIFGEAIWDPVQLMMKFENQWAAIFTLLVLTIATLSTNIAANVVSPANDFSNLWPSKINFRTGGIITGIIGILMFPWKLYADPDGYFFIWLIGYSALLGPIAGIIIADYFVWRRQQLDIDALYSHHGSYRYTHGFSLIAITTLILAMLPNIPGFLSQIKVIDSQAIPAIFHQIYGYAWFIGLITAFILYLLLRTLQQQLTQKQTSHEHAHPTSL